jgi:hypothetical protein
MDLGGVLPGEEDVRSYGLRPHVPLVAVGFAEWEMMVAC